MHRTARRWTTLSLVAVATVAMAVGECFAQDDVQSFASTVGPYPTVDSLHHQLSFLAAALTQVGLDPTAVPVSLHLEENQIVMHIQLRLTCDQFRKAGVQLLRSIGDDWYFYKGDGVSDLAVALFARSGNYTVVPCVVVAGGLNDQGINDWWGPLFRDAVKQYPATLPEGFRLVNF
jgi:hypothetical protein